MWKLRKWKILLIGAIVGIGGFFVLPSSFKFFGFIIPIIMLCIVASPDDEYFNMQFFLVSLFIFFLISTNLVTFDASNPVSFSMVTGAVYAGIITITLIICVGIPMIMIAGAVWAFYIGEITKAVEALVRVLIVVAFVIIFCFMMAILNIETLGISDFILDFYVEIISFTFELPIQLYESVAQITSPLGVDLPKIPENKHFRQPKKPTGPSIGDRFNDFVSDPIGSTGSGIGDFISDPIGSIGDAIGGALSGESDISPGFDALRSASYLEVIFAIHDTLPLFAGLVCLVSVPFFTKRKWELVIQDRINRLHGLDKKKAKKEPRFLPTVNYKMMIFMTIIMVTAFCIFLSYTNAYAINDREDWRYIGFFGIYMFMIIIPLLLMNIQGYYYYTDSNFRNTLKGFIYGMGGIFFITRLFITKQVVNAYSAQPMNNNVMYVVNQFVFVAPAETIFFHIFIPALVAGIIVAYSERNIRRGYELTIQEELALLESKLYAQQIASDIYLMNNKKKAYAKSKAREEKLRSDKSKLMEVDFIKKIGTDSVFGRARSLVIFFVFGVLFSNFAFAVTHCLVSGIDFFVFWNSGLGVVLFVGGCWFSFIAIKYGWLSAILVHASYNSLTIIMVLMFMG